MTKNQAKRERRRNRRIATQLWQELLWLVFAGGLFIWVVSATGCMNWRGPHHPAAGDELRAMGASVDAWVAAGRDDPAGIEHCEPMERLEIVSVTAPDNTPCVFVRNGERRYGSSCTSFGQPSVFETQTHLLISLDTSLDERGRLNGIAHETMHHLRGCTSFPHLRAGTAPAWWGREGAGADVDHRDLELWGPILEDAFSRLP